MKQLKNTKYCGKVKMNRDHKPQKNKMKIPRIHFKYNRDWKRNNKKLGSQTMKRTREQKRKTKIDTMPYRLSQNKIIESICFCEHFRNFRFRIFPLSEELKRNLDLGSDGATRSLDTDAVDRKRNEFCHPY